MHTFYFPTFRKTQADFIIGSDVMGSLPKRRLGTL